MATTPSDMGQNTLNTSNEPKRKVSILTDPPHIQGGGYDNPAFDGPLRKISQVRVYCEKRILLYFTVF